MPERILLKGSPGSATNQLIVHSKANDMMPGEEENGERADGKPMPFWPPAMTEHEYQLLCESGQIIPDVRCPRCEELKRMNDILKGQN